MKILKLLKHDISEGIVRRYAYLLLPVLVSLFSCVGLHFWMVEMQSANVNTGAGSVMDYWIYLVQGGKQYKFDVYNLFSIPIAWVSLYLFFLVCLNNYPIHDLEKWGYQVILCSGSRFNWWLSKILWIICYATVYMAVCFLTVLLYACLNDASASLKATMQLIPLVTKKGFASCPLLHGIVINLILPWFFMILLGILQLVLSVKVSAVQSLILLFMVLVVSTYKRTWFLIGNWGMPYRIYPISESGLNYKICLLLCVVCIGIGMVAGYILFRKKDIFERLQ